MRTFDRDMTTCVATACASLLAAIYLVHSLAGALAYPTPGV
ncbi:MAG: hypothetical protein RLW61_23180 [Gammaproteobacteria bacterium]